MLKRCLISLLLIGVVIGLMAGCGFGVPKNAVAEVNGKVITREDLDREIENLKKQFGGQGGFPEPGSEEYSALEKRMAERLVTLQIISFEAEEMGITVTDDEINEQLEQARSQAGGEEQFKEALASQNLTEDSLKENFRRDLLTNRVYEKIIESVVVTDEDLPKEIRNVRHILVADQATATAVKARLDAGEDFAAVATEVSTDPGSKDKGGDLGAQPPGSFIPEFEAAMNALAVGAISAPVQSQFGFHIIQVTAINPAGSPPYEEAKESMKQTILQKKQQEEADRWLIEAEARYEVEYAEGYDPATIEEPAVDGATETPAEPAATPPPAAQP